MPVEPTATTQPAASPAESEQDGGNGTSSFSRRGFLRVAGAAGLTGVAATVAACAPTAAPAWSFGAPATPGAATAAPTAAPSAAPTAAASAAASVAPSAAPSASDRRGHPARLDRPRHSGPQRGPPVRRRPCAPPSRTSTRSPWSAKLGSHPGRRGRLPGAQDEAGLRPGPPARPDRRAQPADADDGRRRQGLQPHHRRDGVEDRRAAAVRGRARLQRAVARTDDPRHRGRQAPGRSSRTT